MISTRKSAFTSQGGISVTQEQWTDPLELEDNKKVGILGIDNMIFNIVLALRIGI